MALYHSISYHDDRFLVRTLSEEHERNQAFRLRHRVFADKLKWVKPAANGLEIDRYDLWATSVGVFSATRELLAMFRMLPTEGPFMLEREFRSVLSPGSQLRKQPDAAEITRLAIDPDIEDKGLSSRLMLILFKGVYQWSVDNGVRYLYMVVEKRFLRVLRMVGFPCERLSPGTRLPPANSLSVPAVLDWENWRQETERARPDFLTWMKAVNRAAVVASDSGVGVVGAPAGARESGARLVTTAPLDQVDGEQRELVGV